jgi:hypothetical protein
MREHLPISDLLEQVYSRLGTDLSMPVYDYVDPKREYPYITIGAPSAVSASTKTEQICDITVPIDIWTSYRGMKEFTDLAESLVVSLTRSNVDLASAGYRVVRTQFNSFASDKSFDGTLLIQHATLTFMWKVQIVT